MEIIFAQMNEAKGTLNYEIIRENAYIFCIKAEVNRLLF